MNIQRLIRTFKAGKGFDELVLRQKINITGAEKGSCTATFKVDQDTCNNEGYLAPSFVTTVFDTISSLGVMTLHNKIHVSVNINMSFLRPVKLGEEVIINSEIIKSGKSIVYLEGILKSIETGDVVGKGVHVKYIHDKVMFD